MSTHSTIECGTICTLCYSKPGVAATLDRLMRNQHLLLCDDLKRGLFLWILTPHQWVTLEYRRQGPQNAVAAL